MPNILANHLRTVLVELGGLAKFFCWWKNAGLPKNLVLQAVNLERLDSSGKAGAFLNGSGFILRVGAAKRSHKTILP